MDDLQLNIVSTTKKNIKKAGPPQKNVEGYKFTSKPNFGGKIMARKRPQTAGQIKFKDKNTEEPQKKVPKLANVQPKQTDDLASNLRDLSENKGKFQGKDYQQLSDDLQIKQKPRSGAWISSLFKNNPEVPRIGQRAVKPVVEKVFSGNTFADLTIHPHSVANLKQNLNLTELMTVQKKAIPVILQGRDVLIRSQTGSGKTLAYALPVVEALQAIRPKVNRNDGIRVVVVVPTRELAVQTYELFVKLTKPFIWIVPGLLSGGQKRKAEKARLRKGLSILVGTPGRINDHLRHTHSLNFAKTGCLILDEADRLLDMGYEKDVAAIVKSIEDHKRNATYDPIALVRQTNSKKIINTEELSSPNKNDDETPDKHPLTDVFLLTERQTILLSATLTKAVENLAGITMKNPVFVDTAEGKSVVADSLKHSEVAKKVVQNVIKTDKDEGSDAKEEKMQDMKDSDESDSKCNDNKTVPENDNTPSRRGLKAFNGSLYRELFIDEKDNAPTIDKQHLNQSSKPTVSKQTANKDDSDSDSDYEYFKVQKELEAKNINKKDGEDDDEETLVSSPPKIDNTFVEALKTAVKEDELVLPATVNQTFIIVPMKLRLVTLCSQIIEHCVLNKKGGKMIVFMATLEMVDYLSDLIETVLTGKKDKKKEGLKSKKKKAKNDEDDSDSAAESESDYEMDYQGQSEGNLVPVDIDVFSLHGSMPHERRMEVFKQFRQAKRGLLICTDVAARGLDVPRVDLVLQYCAPASITDYVHRVGRTGRAAQVGAAVMFLLPSEAEFVRHLEQKRIRLRQGDESRALEALRTVAAGAASVQRAAICLQARLELLAHSSRDWLARASRAYTSWVRFYSGYPREVRAWLDARQLHLGHAAKAFALRDTPGALAKRSRSDPHLDREKPANRLTVREEEQKKRPGFPKVKIGAFGGRVMNKQSSMHTASEFDNGLPPVDTYNRNNNKKKRK